MRFSSIFTFGALLLPALAAPLLDNAKILNNNEVEVEALNDVMTKVEAIVPVNVKRSAIEGPEDVIETCSGLLISVKAHTAIINQTVVEVVDVATDVQVAAIKIQLNIIVDLCKTVVIALGKITTTVKFAEVEVAKLVDIIICIVLEIVCTLLYVIKCLNIKLLLVEVIANLCQVLACLVIVLEHIVGGILVLVVKILNLPAILCLVGDIFASLLISLSTGKIISI